MNRHLLDGLMIEEEMQINRIFKLYHGKELVVHPPPLEFVIAIILL